MMMVKMAMMMVMAMMGDNVDDEGDDDDYDEGDDEGAQHMGGQLQATAFKQTSSNNSDKHNQHEKHKQLHVSHLFNHVLLLCNIVISELFAKQ